MSVHVWLRVPSDVNAFGNVHDEDPMELPAQLDLLDSGQVRVVCGPVSRKWTARYLFQYAI